MWDLNNSNATTYHEIKVGILDDTCFKENVPTFEILVGWILRLGLNFWVIKLPSMVGNVILPTSAQKACYLPSLGQYPFIHLGGEEQVRVKCLAQRHNTWFHMIWTYHLGIMSTEFYISATHASIILTVDLSYKLSIWACTLTYNIDDDSLCVWTSYAGVNPRVICTQTLKDESCGLWTHSYYSQMLCST